MAVLGLSTGHATNQRDPAKGLFEPEAAKSMVSLARLRIGSQSGRAIIIQPADNITAGAQRGTFHAGNVLWQLPPYGCRRSGRRLSLHVFQNQGLV
jgi:hypothetical protein